MSGRDDFPLSRLGRLARGLYTEGFFSFVSARSVGQALAFLTTIGLARILPRGEFGLWVYASGILQLFMLFSGLGAKSAILRYCSIRTGYARLGTLHQGLAIGVVTNVVLAVVIVGSSRFLSLRIDGASELLLLLALLPLPTFLVAAAVAYFQAASRANDAAAVLLASGILQATSSIALAWVAGVPGVVLGQYLGPLGGIAAIAWRTDRWPGVPVARRLVRFGSGTRQLLRFGLLSMTANVASTILVAMDTLAIGLILGSMEAVASYKVAAILPLGLLFLPLSVMQFFIPRFARQSEDRRQSRRMLGRLLAGLASSAAVIAAALFFLAPQLVTILFGRGYADVTDEVVAPMRILVVGFFLSATLRIPFGNILFALGRVRFNLINSVMTGLINIVLDLWLVAKFGSVGAAIGTVTVIVLSSLISGVYLGWLLRRT